MFVVIAVALAFVLVYMISDPGSFLFIPLGIQKFEEVRTGQGIGTVICAVQYIDVLGIPDPIHPCFRDSVDQSRYLG